jgi:hypothetical protein
VTKSAVVPVLVSTDFRSASRRPRSDRSNAASGSSRAAAADAGPTPWPMPPAAPLPRTASTPVASHSPRAGAPLGRWADQSVQRIHGNRSERATTSRYPIAVRIDIRTRALPGLLCLPWSRAVYDGGDR